MNLILRRRPSNAHCTIGDLYNEAGNLICYTLEDVVREDITKTIAEWKQFGETAIPQGRYKIGITHSQRFNRPLPLLLAVPGFDGVRIHSGRPVTTAIDTSGCILPGMSVSPDENSVLESRYAFTKVYDLIDDELRSKEEVWIEVRN